MVVIVGDMVVVATQEGQEDTAVEDTVAAVVIKEDTAEEDTTTVCELTYNISED
jgi:hypothetical protein